MGPSSRAADLRFQAVEFGPFGVAQIAAGVVRGGLEGPKAGDFGRALLQEFMKFHRGST